MEDKKKIPSRNEVLHYLYDDGEIFLKLRNGDLASEPNGIQILYDFTDEVHKKISEGQGDYELMQDVFLIWDTVYFMMQYRELGWTVEVSDAIMDIIGQDFDF